MEINLREIESASRKLRQNQGKGARVLCDLQFLVLQHFYFCLFYLEKFEYFHSNCIFYSKFEKKNMIMTETNYIPTSVVLRTFFKLPFNTIIYLHKKRIKFTILS